WRKQEHQVRQECGQDPIETSYPGCFPLSRRDRQRQRERQLRRSRMTVEEKAVQAKRKRFQTVADVLLYNEKHQNDPHHADIPIHLDEPDHAPAEAKDWNTWIQEKSHQMNKEDQFYEELKNDEFGGNSTDAALHEQFRKLLEGEEIPWFNYWPMLGVRSE
ncbi:MAG: hypothetical protein SGILL_009564, partial [Bacillariaceae sp.]